MKTYGQWLAVSIFLWISTPIAVAAPIDGDRFSLSVGVFITDRNTDARLDSGQGTGTDTDFEEDLGLSSSDTVFRVDGHFRFAEKHRLDFAAFDLSRDSTKQIDRDIQWGDTLYSVDAEVNAEFDLTIYKAAYTYSFINSERGYMGVSLGLYVADVSTSLAEANLGQAQVGDITAPLPVIGLRGERRLSDRWRLRASSEFFFVDFDNIDGSLVDAYLGVDYGILDNVAIGLGYNIVALDVDTTKSSFQGALDWEYSGALLFLKVDF